MNASLLICIVTMLGSGVNGYINITSIIERADNPCNLNQDHHFVGTSSYDMETGRNILEHMRYASADLYSHYSQLFGCNYEEALQSAKGMMNLPLFHSSATLPTEVKIYYTWLLWAQEAEMYMNSTLTLRNPSFNFVKLHETVNLMMQLACLTFDPFLEVNVYLPFVPSTDPIDFRFRSCVIFETIPKFANAALSSPMRRDRRSSNRGQPKKSDIVLDLHQAKYLEGTQKPVVPTPFRNYKLIDLWTRVQVSGFRQQRNIAKVGAMVSFNGKTSIS